MPMAFGKQDAQGHGVSFRQFPITVRQMISKLCLPGARDDTRAVLLKLCTAAEGIDARPAPIACVSGGLTSLFTTCYCYIVFNHFEL